jgi:ATP-dependent RNA helicase DeaD
MSSPNVPTFSELSLSPAVLQALETTGYERPSPIQAQTIPLLLAGKDVIGQAQTGTGKTAAFALPLLTNLDLDQKEPQVLVLAPTRELAIQVAEAFQTYASHIKGFHVLPVYGGSDYRGQIQGLRRGVHVVVGTPGRVMDHMRRGTLVLSGMKTLVLDEADEMLRMGFIDDVQWILEQAPQERQIALFSATMPPPIRKIANQHLRDPAHISIAMKTVSAETIRQRYWPVRGLNKLDALTRILEAEDFSAMLIFVRTKTLTVELADKLSARGIAASALNGDMSQQLRENTVDKLKNGKLDILVATDVAARGLDVERISHVLNYDIPHDVETYIHRIGRTGRAGREGDAILFVAPREQRMLGSIERATRKKIELLELPSTEIINDKRVARFMQRITDTIAQGGLTEPLQLVERYQREHNVPASEIAAALAKLVQGDEPLLLEKKARSDRTERAEYDEAKPRRERKPRSESDATDESFESKPRRERPRFDKEDSPARAARDESGNRPERRERSESRAERRPVPPPDLLGPTEEGMERFRIEVGHNQNVKPGNIVGAIANEAGIDSQYIGRINIYDDFSVIDLPEGMPAKMFQHLKNVWVGSKQLDISRFESGGSQDAGKYNKAEHKRTTRDAPGSRKSDEPRAERDAPPPFKKSDDERVSYGPSKFKKSGGPRGTPGSSFKKPDDQRSGYASKSRKPEDQRSGYAPRSRSSDDPRSGYAPKSKKFDGARSGGGKKPGKFK